MFGLNSLFCYNSYNGPLWTIMDHNGVVLAIMEKSIFPDGIEFVTLALLNRMLQ